VTAPVLSVVVPVYNEEVVLDEFLRRLAPVMDGLSTPWELIYIDDGSRDRTLEVMLRQRGAGAPIGIVALSRNFGKEIALTAGLDHARGEAVVVIDADLQDPPEVIPELVAAWREGYEMVFAQRRRREGETWLKRTTASLFYRLMQRSGRVTLPRDTGDFRLMSRQVVQAVTSLREHHRFMKGIFAWVGFRSVAVLYDRAPRFAGNTKWNYWKLWNLAIEGITSFTVLPLKVATYLGLAVALVAFAYMAFIIGRTILYGNPVAGYPSLLAIILFLSGVQLVSLGVIGEYLGRVFNESKGRPLYLVERLVPAGSDSAPDGAQANTPIASSTMPGM
jgi:glycosyltransferase involved in cell wall biosynthesis